MKEIEDIDHIPITEEWLRRFGFKDGFAFNGLIYYYLSMFLVRDVERAKRVFHNFVEFAFECVVYPVLSWSS